MMADSNDPESVRAEEGWALAEREVMALRERVKELESTHLSPGAENTWQYAGEYGGEKNGASGEEEEMLRKELVDLRKNFDSVLDENKDLKEKIKEEVNLKWEVQKNNLDLKSQNVTLQNQHTFALRKTQALQQQIQHSESQLSSERGALNDRVRELSGARQQVENALKEAQNGLENQKALTEVHESSAAELRKTIEETRQELREVGKKASIQETHLKRQLELKEQLLKLKSDLVLKAEKKVEELVKMVELIKHDVSSYEKENNKLKTSLDECLKELEKAQGDKLELQDSLKKKEKIDQFQANNPSENWSEKLGARYWEEKESLMLKLEQETNADNKTIILISLVEEKSKECSEYRILFRKSEETVHQLRTELAVCTPKLEKFEAENEQLNILNYNLALQMETYLVDTQNREEEFEVLKRGKREAEANFDFLKKRNKHLQLQVAVLTFEEHKAQQLRDEIESFGEDKILALENGSAKRGWSDVEGDMPKTREKPAQGKKESSIYGNTKRMKVFDSFADIREAIEQNELLKTQLLRLSQLCVVGNDRKVKEVEQTIEFLRGKVDDLTASKDELYHELARALENCEKERSEKTLALVDAEKIIVEKAAAIRKLEVQLKAFSSWGADGVSFVENSAENDDDGKKKVDKKPSENNEPKKASSLSQYLEESSAEYMNMRKVLEEKCSLHQQLSGLARTVEEMQKTHKSTTEELLDLRTEQSKYRVSSEFYQQQCADLTKRLEEMQKMLNIKGKEIADSTALNDSLKNKLSEADNAVGDKIRAEKNMALELEELKKENKVLEKTTGDLQKDTEDIAKSKNIRITALERVVAQAQTALDQQLEHNKHLIKSHLEELNQYRADSRDSQKNDALPEFIKVNNENKLLLNQINQLQNSYNSAKIKLEEKDKHIKFLKTRSISLTSPIPTDQAAQEDIISTDENRPKTPVPKTGTVHTPLSTVRTPDTSSLKTQYEQNLKLLKDTQNELELVRKTSVSWRKLATKNRDEYETLKSSFEAEKEKYKDMWKQVSDLETKNSQLAAQKSDLGTLESQHKKEIDCYESRLNDKSDLVVKLENRYKEEIEDLNKRISLLNSKSLFLEEEKNRLESDNRSQIQNRNRDIEALNTATTERTNLKKENESLSTKLSQQELALENAKTLKETEIATSKKTIQNMSEKLEKLNEDNAALHKLLNERLDHLGEATLQEHVDRVNKHRSIIEEELELARLQINRLNSENIYLKNLTKQQKIDSKNQEEKLEELQNTFEATQSSLAEISETTILRHNNDRLRKDLAFLQKQFSEVRQKLDTELSQNSPLKLEITRLKAHLEENKKAIDFKQQTCEKWEQNYNALLTTYKSVKPDVYAKLQVANQTLNSEILKLTENLEKQSVQLKDTLETNTRLQKEKNILLLQQNAEKDKLKTDLNSKTEENVNLKREISDLKQSSQQTENSFKSSQRLSAQKQAELSQSKAVLEQRVTQLSHSNQLLNEKAVKLTEELTGLRKLGSHNSTKISPALGKAIAKCGKLTGVCSQLAIEALDSSSISAVLVADQNRKLAASNAAAAAAAGDIQGLKTQVSELKVMDEERAEENSLEKEKFERDQNLLKQTLTERSSTIQNLNEKLNQGAAELNLKNEQIASLAKTNQDTLTEIQRVKEQLKIANDTHKIALQHLSIYQQKCQVLEAAQFQNSQPSQDVSHIPTQKLPLNAIGNPTLNSTQSNPRQSAHVPHNGVQKSTQKDVQNVGRKARGEKATLKGVSSISEGGDDKEISENDVLNAEIIKSLPENQENDFENNEDIAENDGANDNITENDVLESGADERNEGNGQSEENEKCGIEGRKESGASEEDLGAQEGRWERNERNLEEMSGVFDKKDNEASNSIAQLLQEGDNEGGVENIEAPSENIEENLEMAGNQALDNVQGETTDNIPLISEGNMENRENTAIVGENSEMGGDNNQDDIEEEEDQSDNVSIILEEDNEQEEILQEEIASDENASQNGLDISEDPSESLGNVDTELGQLQSSEIGYQNERQNQHPAFLQSRGDINPNIHQNNTTDPNNYPNIIQENNSQSAIRNITNVIAANNGTTAQNANSNNVTADSEIPSGGQEYGGGIDFNSQMNVAEKEGGDSRGTEMEGGEQPSGKNDLPQISNNNIDDIHENNNYTDENNNENIQDTQNDCENSNSDFDNAEIDEQETNGEEIYSEDPDQPEQISEDRISPSIHNDNANNIHDTDGSINNSNSPHNHDTNNAGENDQAGSSTSAPLEQSNLEPEN